ncbi:BamA/TamA family outer membrane protein [bacterium]|nr:BamA/TamA family outer membrane protein [bacterium]
MKYCKALIIFTVLFITPLYANSPKTIDLETIVNSFNALETQSAPTKTQTQKNKISDIKIIGNKNIPLKLISNEINLKPGDQANNIKINQIIKNIKSLGLFSNVEYQLQKASKNHKILIFKVKENPLVKNIIFKGATKINSEKLRETISSQKNKVFNYNTLRKDMQNIEKLYKDQGYFLAKIYKVDVPTSKNKNLVFYIGEGILDKILITGNTTTKDYVIFREIKTKPGDVLNQKELRKDLKNIFNLNYFSEALPDFIPAQEPAHYILKINLTEKSSSSINFGGGYGDTSGLFVFADVYWDNILGTGQLVSLKGQFARQFKSSTYQFKYHNPWMWPERKAFTFRAWHTNGEQAFLSNLTNAGAISYRDEIRNGLDASVSIPLDEKLRVSHKIRLENINVTDDNNVYSVQSYTPMLSYDTRDVWFNPLNGDYYTWSVEKGFKINADSLNFIKTDLGLRKFFQTFENQTIATRIELGYMAGDLQDSELYYTGGVNTVRGYSDLSPYSVGSKRLLASIEYRVSFNEVFQGVLFIDTGLASNSLENVLSFSQGYKIGKGFGLRLNTPLGPFRLDFGNNEQGNWYTHFNIGHAF